MATRARRRRRALVRDRRARASLALAPPLRAGDRVRVHMRETGSGPNVRYAFTLRAQLDPTHASVTPNYIDIPTSQDGVKIGSGL